jgi:protein gp37
VSENTNIEWCDHTFNPWEGCQKVGPGCDHCYAETRNARFGGGVAVNWGPGAPRRRTSETNWRKPLQWDAAAAGFLAEHGRRQRVFCASLADVFDNQVDPAWRADLFRLIADTPNLDWLLLTKRIGNAAEMIAEAVDFNDLPCWPWPRVWLGATIVTQVEADRDIPKLLSTPAAVRFLSMEPLLESVRLPVLCACGCRLPIERAIDGAMRGASALNREQAEASVRGTLGVDWVIIGGESGHDARPMNPQWVRELRDQCAAGCVAFLHKQNGEFASVSEVAGPGAHHTFEDHRTVRRVGKKAAGRLVDGVQHDGYPGARA